MGMATAETAYILRAESTMGPPSGARILTERFRGYNQSDSKVPGAIAHPRPEVLEPAWESVAVSPCPSLQRGAPMCI